MAISILLLLSAILAPVSSSPLIPREIHQRDEALPSNQAGPIITGLSPPATAPASAEEALPPCPASVRHTYGSHRLRSPHPSQTAPIPLHPRLDIQPVIAPTPSPDAEIAPNQGCTTTLSEKGVNPCFWDGTKTIYPSTTTLYRSVDCHGCANLDVNKEWWYCPNMRINVTTAVSTPTTYWSTICGAPTARAQAKRLDVAATPTVDATHITTRPEVWEIEGRAKRGQAPSPEAIAACPTTFVVQPEKSAGRTLTVYSKYTTTTVFLNCGGCPLVVSTALAGYGPANGFTKTTTLPIGTATSYACY